MSNRFPSVFAFGVMFTALDLSTKGREECLANIASTLTVTLVQTGCNLAQQSLWGGPQRTQRQTTLSASTPQSPLPSKRA